MSHLGGNEKTTGRNDEFSNKKLLLTGLSIFFGVTAACIFLIDQYYQTTLDKHRNNLRNIFEIKTEVISILIDNATKYEHEENEQAFKDLLFSQKSMYGLQSFVSVVYIAQKSDGIVYLFHYENGEAYPTLEIKLFNELDEVSKKALTQKPGELEGVDFSGDNVFGFHSRLKNLDWAIITKSDYKDIREPFLVEIIIILTVAIVCFLASFIVFRRLNRSHIEGVKRVAERSNQLLTTSTHVTYTLNPDNYAPTYVSGNVKEFIGYEVEAIIGNAQFWREHVHTDDIAKVRADMSTLYKEGRVVFEYRLRRGNGEYVWIQDTSRLLRDKNGVITEIIGAWVDVTNIKAAKVKINEQKEYFENILQNLSTPTFIIDPNHIVIFWNKACEDLTGLPAEKVIGTNQHWRGFYRLQRPCLADAYIDQIETSGLYISTKKMEFNEDVLSAENWCTMYNGQRLYLSLNVGPIYDKDGNLIAVVENARDLSEHRNLETELMDARDKALEAVNIKGQFVANMSHEIRTPMNGVLGMLDLMKQTKLSKEQNELVDTAFYSAESLLDIINEVLDFSKLDAGKLQIEIIKFDLHKELNNIGRLFKLKAEENSIEFKEHIDGNVPKYVYGDPTRFRQVLINLLSNACKFTEEGFVYLDITAHEQLERDVFIRFDVKDSGIGIPQDKQNDLFDEFNQIDASTTRKFGGTGLGLTITKKLLELLNGRIEVKSEPGLGSCFSVFIPFEVVDSKDQGLPDNVFALPAKEKTDLKEFSHKKLLLVEDNKVNQKVTLGILKKLSLSADVAENGKEAVAKVKEGDYDLIFMDCQMPIMNGYDATDLIRQYEKETNRSHVPIVAMTANAMPGDKEKCFVAGMDDYLSKPIDKTLFKETLFKWLNINNEHNNEVYTMSNENDSGQSSVLDASVLEELRAIMEDEFAEILQIYLDESVSLMSDIHNGFNEESDSLLRAVHTLKSSSNNVGGTVLGEVAARMEALVKDNDIETAKTHLNELQDVFTKTHSHIKKYMEDVINDVAV